MLHEKKPLTIKIKQKHITNVSLLLKKAIIDIFLSQREEIVMIQVCGERVLSENRMKRKRLSDQKK